MASQSMFIQTDHYLVHYLVEVARKSDVIRSRKQFISHIGYQMLLDQVGNGIDTLDTAVVHKPIQLSNELK